MTAPFLHSPLLSTIPGLVHGFTRRTLPSGEVLDLGRGASPARWAWLAAALGAPGAGVALAHQVHGERVCAVHGAGLAGRCDALLTDTRGLLLAIRTADCVPALVVGRDGQLAAIHAGWRGVAAGVVPAALAAMRAPWRAAVGPCISGAAYEVGEEVIAGIAAAGVPERIFARRAPGMRPHADLSAARPAS